MDTQDDHYPAAGSPPDGADPRQAAVRSRIRALGGGPDALIEVLHTAQDQYGYLDSSVLAEVAQALGVPLSAVYGVATFYSHFTLHPHGAHTCVVCTGTACHIARSERILDAARALAGERADAALTVLTTRCPGTCSLAPAVLVDGVTAGPVTADQLTAWLRPLLEPHATVSA